MLTLKPFYLGRILGVPIYAHYSWLPVFPLYAWLISAGLLPRNVPGLPLWQYWSLGILTTVLLFASVLAHELSHSVMARAEGQGTGGITLYLFGGLASIGSQPANPSTEFKIAVVGPAASFILGTIFYGLDQLLFYRTTHLAISQVFRHLGTVNWLLAAFNILPGLPLDGGRVLRAIVWKVKKNYTEATRTAVRAGLTISLALIFSGLYIFPKDMVMGTWTLFIGILLAAMLISSRRPAGKKVAPGSVASVMTRDVVSVAPDIKLDYFIDNILRNNHFTTFPVAASGRLHGLLLLEQMKSVPPEDWPRLTAGEVMRPVDSTLFIQAGAPVSQAQSLLASNGIGRAAVLDSSGFLVGYLSVNDFKNRH